MTPEIKICGITNLEDAEVASSSGASILGVVLAERSPRKGTPELVEELSSFGYHVAGVYTDLDSIKKEATDEEYIQLHFLHGSDEIEYVHGKLGKKTISVVFPEENKNYLVEARDKLLAGTDLVLADFGRSITEKDCREIPDLKGNRIGLAGKISIDNLQVAMSPNPYFLDLSSRLEAYPGKKDHEKVRRFMEVFRNEISAL